MKIKDWMKLGAGVALAYCTYSFTTGVIEGVALAGVALAALDETDKKDSKPENEEES